MSGKTFNFRILVLLALAVAAYAGASRLVTRTLEKHEPRREELKQELPPVMRARKLQQCKKTPGRVVQLSTSKGIIEFVLLEEDCPKTTARIAKLVQEGCYDGVRFVRVIDGKLIQTDECKKKVKPIDCEVCTGLTHAKGSVGMAREKRVFRGNTSVFYITLEPCRHLDLEYTNFGRVITGMDAAMKIGKGDTIHTAKLRPLTEADEKRYKEILTIESERKTR